MLDLSNKSFIKTLKMLRIISRRFFHGQKMGGRITRRTGSSVEFSDYKEYQLGDDIRFIDWNIYGRLDKMLVKLFYNEENLSSYILLDCSSSMNFGNPSKFDYGRRLAAAISYVAAANNDSVRIFCFSDGLKEFSPKADRSAHVLPLFRFLESCSSGGISDFSSAVAAFTKRFRKAGVVFVLSDFMFDKDSSAGDRSIAGGGLSADESSISPVSGGPLETGIKHLSFCKHDVNLIQVLSPEEINPSYDGLWDFTDSETNSKKRVFIDDSVLTLYREALEEHFSQLDTLSKRNGMNYLRTLTDVPFENLVLRLFSQKR